MLEFANVLMCKPLLFQVAYLDDMYGYESKIFDDMYKNSFYSVQVPWIEYADRGAPVSYFVVVVVVVG